MNKWTHRFIDLAKHISQWSKDHKKVGCVVTSQDNKVLATGYNGMPTWFQDQDLFDLDPYDKGRMISHAEENALNVLDLAHKDKELNLYVTFPPCKWCSMFIIHSIFNIKQVCYITKEDKEFNEKYAVDSSIKLLEDAGIQVIKYIDDSSSN